MNWNMILLDALEKIQQAQDYREGKIARENVRSVKPDCCLYQLRWEF